MTPEEVNAFVDVIGASYTDEELEALTRETDLALCIKNLDRFVDALLQHFTPEAVATALGESLLDVEKAFFDKGDDDADH